MTYGPLDNINGKWWLILALVALAVLTYFIITL
jgi:hypothetical protein